jgi:hypothetical protein
LSSDSVRPLNGRCYPIYLTSVTFTFDGLAHVATIGSFRPLDPADLDPEQPFDLEFDWPKSLKVVEVEVERASVLLGGLDLLVVDGDPLPMTAKQVLKRAFDGEPGFSISGGKSDAT